MVGETGDELLDGGVGLVDGGEAIVVLYLWVRTITHKGVDGFVIVVSDSDRERSVAPPVLQIYLSTTQGQHLNQRVVVVCCRQLKSSVAVLLVYHAVNGET